MSGEEAREPTNSQAPRPQCRGASEIHDNDGASLTDSKDQLECSHVSLVLSQIGIRVLVNREDVKPNEGRVRGITEVVEDSLHSLQEASLPGICDRESLKISNSRVFIAMHWERETHER